MKKIFQTPKVLVVRLWKWVIVWLRITGACSERQQKGIPKPYGPSQQIHLDKEEEPKEILMLTPIIADPGVFMGMTEFLGIMDGQQFLWQHGRFMTLSILLMKEEHV